MTSACAPKYGSSKPRSKRGPWRAGVLLLVHAAIAIHIVQWRLSGRTLSALEPSEAGLLVAEGVINAGFVLLAIALLATLVFGRFFCGWACHVVALQDAAGWLLGKFGLRPKPIRSRVLMFVPWLAALEVFLLPGILRFWRGAPAPPLEVELMTEDLWSRFPGPWVALATFFVVGFAIVWLLGMKGFCTYGCPYGALFGAADRFARGRIRVDLDACEACGHCTSVCTSDVAVSREVRSLGMVTDAGCMKCMDCVSACPKDALSFSFGALPDRAQAKAQASKTRFDFNAAEELALGALFLIGLYAFRNLYGLIPFLMAVALAVIAAFVAVSAWRFVRRDTFRVQHHTLRRDGRVTPTGFAASTLGSVLLLFMLHSFVVQRFERSGSAQLAAASALPAGPERAELVARAESSLSKAARIGLTVPQGLHAQLGAIELERGDTQSAIRHLRRALEGDSQSLGARDALYRALVQAERWPEAAIALSDLLNVEALRGRPLVAQRALSLTDDVVAMIQDEPEAVLPQLILARLLIAVGDADTARANLERLRERHPDDERIQARLDALP